MQKTTPKVQLFFAQNAERLMADFLATFANGALTKAKQIVKVYVN